KAINGNYTYYVTYTAPGIAESRPSGPLGPLNVVDGNALLSDLPPLTGAYNVPGAKINIYRNVDGQVDTFYRVGQVDPTTNPNLNFIDNVPDATITNSDLTTNPLYNVLDLDGPKIASNTLLVNVLSRTGNTYTNLFVPGTLSFQGNQNGNDLSAKTLNITSTS